MFFYKYQGLKDRYQFRYDLLATLSAACTKLGSNTEAISECYHAIYLAKIYQPQGNDWQFLHDLFEGLWTCKSVYLNMATRARTIWTKLATHLHIPTGFP